jgi:DNA-binding CsgD family transcriptional regulator
VAVSTEVKARSGQELKIHEEALWQNARGFVAVPRRKAMIRTYARKFMIFSPYEIRDYLSEAHVAAYEAMKACIKNGEEHMYERYFWTLVKSAFARMSTNPSQKDVIPGEDAGPMAVVFETYAEEWTEREGKEKRPTRVVSSAQTPGRLFRPESIESILHARQVRAALAAMTAKQRDVWLLIMEGRDASEIARILGASRQNVEKLRETGLKKVAKHVEGGFVL